MVSSQFRDSSHRRACGVWVGGVRGDAAFDAVGVGEVAAGDAFQQWEGDYENAVVAGADVVVALCARRGAAG